MNTQASAPIVGGPSPWGAIQTRREIAPGIVRVTTASHGGIWLAADRLAQMPSGFVRPSAYHDGLEWFEEDCEAALVILAFPAAFPAESLVYAKAAAARWFPGLAI
mgnify:CR=1 FL=1